jgi:hypothetical protein
MTGLSVLGIDLGTVHVRALVDRGDGRGVVPLLVDGLPAGAASIRSGADTQRPVPNGCGDGTQPSGPGPIMQAPLRSLGGDPVQVGGIAVDPAQVVASQLAAVAARAVADLGGPPNRVVIGVPPGWGPRRDRLLCTAASQAGLPEPQLVAEPVAAVCHAVRSGLLDAAAGDCVLVCDLGAASADLSVVQYWSTSAGPIRPTLAGWVVLATRACPPLAGLHLDQALLDEVATRHGTDPARWQRLRQPATAPDWSQGQELAGQLEQAKHRLAAGNPAAVVLPAPHLAVLLQPHILDCVLRPALAALPEYAMSALFALLCGLSLAAVSATALLYHAHTDPDPARTAVWQRRAGQLITGAAGMGVLAAGVYGLIGAVTYPMPNSPFLHATLWAVVPTAAIAALIGLIAPRAPALRATGWAHRLQQPLLPIMLASLGMVSVTVGEYTTGQIPLPLLSRLPATGIATHVGGAILGVAIALTLFSIAWKQVAACIILGLGGLVATTLFTTPTLGYSYITAVTLWWIRQALAIAADASPATMARIRGTAGHGRSLPPSS